MTSVTDIQNAIDALGLADKTIALHCSMKSFGDFEAGADGLIETFQQAGCTLVVPTFTYACETQPIATYQQNGIDPVSYSVRPEPKSFSRQSPCSREMGILPQQILNQKEAIRGNHPLNSLTGIGPRASELISDQRPLDVYAPYKRLFARDDGVMVLAGVTLTSATPVHFAEQAAGKTMFRRWAKIETGIAEVEVGSCSNGFDKLLPRLNQLITRREVGSSTWLTAPFRPFVELVAEILKQDPGFLHCGQTQCIRCNDMGQGGPLFDSAG